MGGRNKRSAYFYDLWNVQYLRHFSWADLVAEKQHDKRYEGCLYFPW